MLELSSHIGSPVVVEASPEVVDVVSDVEDSTAVLPSSLELPVAEDPLVPVEDDPLAVELVDVVAAPPELSAEGSDAGSPHAASTSIDEIVKLFVFIMLRPCVTLYVD